MPKSPSKIIKLFRVRIDGRTDDEVVRFCESTTERYLLVFHQLPMTEERPNGNPHHHFYCETTLSQGNYANKLKLALNVVGDQYCVQKCDIDRRAEFLSYLFNTKKDNKSNYVSSKDFNPLDIAIYKENANTITKEFEARMKEKKKSQFDIVELVINRMNPEQLCFPEIIYDNVIEVCKLNRTLPRPYHVRDMISSVMSLSGNARGRKTAKDITLKFFSNS